MSFTGGWMRRKVKCFIGGPFNLLLLMMMERFSMSLLGDKEEVAKSMLEMLRENIMGEGSFDRQGHYFQSILWFGFIGIDRSLMSA